MTVERIIAADNPDWKPRITSQSHSPYRIDRDEMKRPRSIVSTGRELEMSASRTKLPPRQAECQGQGRLRRSLTIQGSMSLGPCRDGPADVRRRVPLDADRLLAGRMDGGAAVRTGTRRRTMRSSGRACDPT